MQLKPIAAIIVLSLVVASLSVVGCTESTSVTYPPEHRSDDQRYAFCDNATLRTVVNSISFELTKRFEYFSPSYESWRKSLLDNETWRFSGDYIVIFSNAEDIPAKTTTTANVTVNNRTGVTVIKTYPPMFGPCNSTPFNCCLEAIGWLWDIKDLNNFTNASNFTAFYVVSHFAVVGMYEGGGSASQTSYDIIVVKYPEKHLIGNYHLSAPDVPEKIPKGGLGAGTGADYESWIASHRI